MLPVELWEQVVNLGRGRRGRNRMVVGFTTTCPISDNISFISCRSVLLVDETGVPGGNYRRVTSH
jgi:hypothetical protein